MSWRFQYNRPATLSASGTLSTFLKGELTDWQAETLTTADLITSYRNTLIRLSAIMRR